VNTLCPNCGKDTGGSRFCPHCGVQTSQPVVPYATVAPQSKKRTALWVAIALLAFLIVAAAVVVPLLLLRGGGVKVEITSPEKSAEVSTSKVKVSLDVSNPGKVGWVAIYVDGIMQDSIKKLPFVGSVPAGEAGLHGLRAAVYDPNGRLLAEDETSYKKTGGEKKDGGDETKQVTEQYKKAVSAQINEANLLVVRIKNAASQINGQLSKKYISASLVSDVQALYNRTVSLNDTVLGLKPPAEMADIQAQFTQLCQYLKTRADALVRGAESVNSGGDYMAEFNMGADAKTAFDKAWPVFLNTCRARGISV
jgi:hypothetical protein